MKSYTETCIRCGLDAAVLCSCRKQWLLVREKSTFVDWQRVKVQELSEEVRAIDALITTNVCSVGRGTCKRLLVQAPSEVRTCGLQVPAGSLPRTMDVILRNDIVEAVRAGDKVSSAAHITAEADYWCRGTWAS